MAASPISLKSLVPGTQRGDPAFGSVGLFLGLRDLPRRKGGVFIRARVRHPDHAPGVDSELGATEVLPISEPNLDFTLPIPLHLAGPPGSVDLRLVVFEVFACREGALPLPGATPAPAAVAALDTEALGEHVDRVLSAPADRGTPADGTALLDATAGGAGVFAPVFERLRARGGAPPADGGLAPFIIITATPLTPQARALGALQLRLSFRGLPVRPSTSRPSAPFLMVHRHVGASEAALGDADFEVAWVSKPRRGGGKRDPNAPPPPGTPPFTSDAVTVTVPLVSLLSRGVRGAGSVAALRVAPGSAAAYVKLEVVDWDAGAGMSEGNVGDVALTLSKMGHLTVHLGELVDPSFYPPGGVVAALQTEGTVSAGAGSAAVVIHGVQLLALPWPESVPTGSDVRAPEEAARAVAGMLAAGGGGFERGWGDGEERPPQPAAPAIPSLPLPPPTPLPTFHFSAPPLTPSGSAVSRYIAEHSDTSPSRSTRIEFPTEAEQRAAVEKYGWLPAGGGGSAPLSPPPQPPSAPPTLPTPRSPPEHSAPTRLSQSISDLQAVSRAAAEKSAAARLSFSKAPPQLSPSKGFPPLQQVPAAGGGVAQRAPSPQAPPQAPQPLPPTTIYAASLATLPTASSLLAAAASASSMANALGIAPGAPPLLQQQARAAAPPPVPGPAPLPPVHPSDQLEKASLLVARSAVVLARLHAASVEPPRSAAAPGEWIRAHMDALESGELGGVLPPAAARVCLSGASLSLPRAAFSSVDEALVDALKRDVAAVADALQRAGGEEAAAARTQAARSRGALSSEMGFSFAAAAAAASGGLLPPPPAAFGPEKTLDSVPAFQLEALKGAAAGEVAALTGDRWPLNALEALDAHGAMRAALGAAMSVLASGEARAAGARETLLREYDAAHCEALYLGGRRDAAARELGSLRDDAGALLERLRAAQRSLRAAIKEVHARVCGDARRVAALEGYAWAGDDAARERERASAARMRALGAGGAPQAGAAALAPPPLRSVSSAELLALSALEAANPTAGRSRRLGLAVGRAQAAATGLHAESYSALLQALRAEGEEKLAAVRAAGEERVRAEAAMAEGVMEAGGRDGAATEASARAAAEAAEAAREAELARVEVTLGGAPAPLPPPIFAPPSASQRLGAGEALEQLVGAAVSAAWVARRLRARLADVEERIALLSARFGGARDLSRLKDLCRVLWAHHAGGGAAVGGGGVTPLERQRFLARALSQAPYSARLHEFLEGRSDELRAAHAAGGAGARISPNRGPLTPLKPFSYFSGAAVAPRPPSPQLAKIPGTATSAYLGNWGASAGAYGGGQVAE